MTNPEQIETVGPQATPTQTDTAALHQRFRDNILRLREAANTADGTPLTMEEIAALTNENADIIYQLQRTSSTGPRKKAAPKKKKAEVTQVSADDNLDDL